MIEYMVGNHILRLCTLVTVKLNFQPYIRGYTSPNENFEYSYPLISILASAIPTSESAVYVHRTVHQINVWGWC